MRNWVSPDNMDDPLPDPPGWRQATKAELDALDIRRDRSLRADYDANGGGGGAATQPLNKLSTVRDRTKLNVSGR